jgi:hypothetical protein
MPIASAQVIDSTFRSIRRKRQNRMSWVRGGYTARAQSLCLRGAQRRERITTSEALPLCNPEIRTIGGASSSMLLDADDLLHSLP